MSSIVMHVGGPLHGQDIESPQPHKGYRGVSVSDGPLSVTYAVHESISADAAPREIRRVIAHLHNATLRGQKQPLYGTPEAVAMVHRELLQVWMRAEFLGVVIEAGRESLAPRAMGNTRGWINVFAKTL